LTFFRKYAIIILRNDEVVLDNPATSSQRVLYRKTERKEEMKKYLTKQSPYLLALVMTLITAALATTRLLSVETKFLLSGADFVLTGALVWITSRMVKDRRPGVRALILGSLMLGTMMISASLNPSITLLTTPIRWLILLAMGLFMIMSIMRFGKSVPILPPAWTGLGLWAWGIFYSLPTIQKHHLGSWLIWIIMMGYAGITTLINVGLFHLEDKWRARFIETIRQRRIAKAHATLVDLSGTVANCIAILIEDGQVTPGDAVSAALWELNTAKAGVILGARNNHWPIPANTMAPMDKEGTPNTSTPT